VFEETLRAVPDYRVFHTVDELNASSEQLAREFSGSVKLIKIGRSREKDDILALRIGKGKKKAVLFALPHPNEPIGAMTLEYFSRRLAEEAELEKLDFTWFIVKCIDPDGARLNEGWFKGPFTPLHVAMNFYRPPNYQQIEWTFPVDHKTLHWHKPLPETRALMRLIDETKPAFLYSLHNSFFGGVYFYVGANCSPLYPKFRTFVEKENLPLHLGQPEAPFIKRLAPAVFKMFSVGEYYDYQQKHTKKDPAKTLRMGANSDEYARRVANTFCLAVEMPYWFDPRIADASDSDITRREAILHGSAMTLQRNKFIRRKYLEIRRRVKPSEDRKSFSDAVEYFTRRNIDSAEADAHWANSDPLLRRKASVAEKFDSYVAQGSYDLFWLGMLYRYVKGTGNRSAESEVLAQLQAWSGELSRQASLQVIPIRSLVRVQLGSALLVCSYLQNAKIAKRRIRATHT